MNRRDFVQLMGLVSGASFLSSCNLDRKSEKLIPYLVPPDDGVIPGQAVYTRTTCMECPAGCGVSAKTVDYRAGKLEGIEGHPINDGALCIRGQASLSRLYHPNRITQPLRGDGKGDFQPTTWDEAYAAIVGAMRSAGGRTHVFLSGRTSGSLSQLVDEFCAATGTERLPEFETFSHAAIREANRIVFDRAEIPAYRIESADFLLTVGADIFETFVSPVSHAVQFGRAKRGGHFAWHHAEPHVSLTGMQAQRRFVVAPGSEPHLLAFLLRRVSRENLAGDRRIADLVEALPGLSARGYAETTGLSAAELDDLAHGLLSAKSPLVIAGGVSTMNAQGLETAVLTALLQWATGSIGKTVDFSMSEDYARVGSAKDMQRFSERLEAGSVGVAFMSRVDPVGTVPASFAMRDKLARASLRVGLGEFITDSMETCDYVLPLSDALESWGDSTPKRGVMTVVQPVIEPMHDSRNEGDVLLQLAASWNGQSGAPTYQEYLFSRWTNQIGPDGLERFLADGFVKTPGDDRGVHLNRDAVEQSIRSMALSDASAKPVLIVAPSIRFFDGRSGDMPLMHEIPDPLTTISWGEWLSVSPETAGEMDVADKGEVTVSSNGWSTDRPVKIQQGLPRGVMTLEMRAAREAPITVDQRTGEWVVVVGGVSMKRTGKKVPLPILSGSQSQEGRGVIPDPAAHHEGESKHHHDPKATLYPEKHHPDYRWGMAIDLELCIGCAACVSACYIENNVPVVGEKQHVKGREMAWIRIEPFYENEGVEFQPMLCQQCTNAPCEAVCPVYATYHNAEGLNAQVYNRCVGTRYCSNNCPYKVRRFNWFDFKRPTELNTTRNPEVSVRGRGIMEKCTFCVQRVRSARDHAKDNSRKILDGEVTPACAQTCPTQAIVFGDLQDETTEVHAWATSSRSHRVFEGLGTDPAIYYLRSTWKNDHA
jgi:molybdopterin-containing oxidoreductase family iron-sulfur binding subunit